MTFTLNTLADALAEHLAPELPGASMYADPIQQGTDLPALFMQLTNARIAKKMGDRFLRRLGLDLIYLIQPNGLTIHSTLQAAADTLDGCMELFPYNGALLRAYDRHWEITDDVLHYKFELKLWLSKDEDAALMESIQKLHMEENHERDKKT